MTRTHFWHVAVWAILLASAAAGRAEVTSLQNDVAPTKDYAGCRDTWISNEDWERNHTGSASACTAAASGTS